ncbi:MAG: EutN/CcmL family microcompartment protein [Deltaproteobacteria bacterium]|nr:EutN/CcmL family microcompartment protein [Deltaproteobacteria bacterium]MBW1934349.1 EutN/CcmL family microcompartment protein [Deltaproteobacteria bacterium]MBW1978473.1 EutN/CcmL family microcompartment protein [Deltaproteobacteria bacterium]MBW2043467.1 EutN/CcmL family microcompartment protein [Deltaproteobacteria bacterium]MBW2299413.1 EutN/CcmL family microcompartment protein [Deltaproteobacteria bacterium]
MKLCKVIGFATSSIKREGLSPYKLLVLKNIDDEGNPVGEAFLALDTVGAGLSEIVAVTTGAPATNAVGDKNLPIDAAVIGILDQVTINKKEVYTKNKEE